MDVTRVAAPDALGAVTAPAAVLLVSLADTSVVHLNPVAHELAPGVSLPVSLDAWSDAARLRDVMGEELSGTTHPLSRVARSEPVSGQAVTAGRRTTMGEGRDALWVVALPMTGAPMLDDHVLIVLIPLRDAGAHAAVVDAAEHASPAGGGEHAALRERAVLATTMSFTVADARQPGQPLVWVNPAFTATTGYELGEVVGRNCRFLQGPATDPASPALMRAAIEAGEPVSTTLLNYRRDGSAFWNQVDLSPVHDAAGVLTHFVGIQTDVTGRVEIDRARELALRSEQEARARLAFMVEAVNQLGGTLTVEECTERLLHLAVPQLADWALMFLVDEHQQLSGLFGQHADPDRQGEVDEFAQVLPIAMRTGSTVDLLMNGQQVRLIENLTDASSLRERAGYLSDLSVTDRTAALDGRVALCVALPGRTDVEAVLVLVRGPDRPEFDADDVDAALDLGHRAGLIFENTRLYQAQHLIAETLQRSLLSETPEIDGLDVDAHYRVGAREAQVGGDFYELMKLPGDCIGVVIGDVIGHDVYAAAAMGHLKGMVRALAYTSHARDHGPSDVLADVDHLIAELDIDTLATGIYGELRRTTDGWDFRWANAGHPPPVLRRPDGTVEVLGRDEPADPILGVAAHQRRDRHAHLPLGSTLVLYTDGLIEQRGVTIDDGIDQLAAVVAATPPDAGKQCRALLDADISGDTDDDVALIALHLLG